MQFRFTDYPPNYEANHFLYEIERAGGKIEMLESLNKLQIRMIDNDKIQTN